MTDQPCPPIASLGVVDETHRDIAAAWVRDALWAAIADLFHHYQEEQGLTYADLGRRIDRSRSQVQRWLDAPVNMTLRSAGLLVEGLDADLRIGIEPRCQVGLSTNEACPADLAHAMVAAAGLHSIVMDGQHVLRGRIEGARPSPTSSEPYNGGNQLNQPRTLVTGT